MTQFRIRDVSATHMNTSRTEVIAKLGLRLEALRKDRQGLHAHGTDLIGEKLATAHMTGQGVELTPVSLEHAQAIKLWAANVQENNEALALADRQHRNAIKGAGR